MDILVNFSHFLALPSVLQCMLNVCSMYAECMLNVCIIQHHYSKTTISVLGVNPTERPIILRRAPKSEG